MEIKSESEYQAALKRLDVVFMADQSTPEGEELRVLAEAIEAYEDIHHPIGPPAVPTIDGLLFPPTSGATFSPCGNYRYKLWRIWDSSKPMIAFIGLNPSTANATSDDPTIRRVKGFAKQWGYGGVYMLNLFGIISSDPSILLTANDPIGDNDRHLLEAAIDGLRIVFAWGSFKQIGERDKDVIAMFPNAICLKKSGAGKPWHPLYVKADIQPIYFNSELPWETTYH